MTTTHEDFLSALYDLIDFHSRLRRTEPLKVWEGLIVRLAMALGAQAATYYEYLPAKRHLLPRSVLGGAEADIARSAVDIRTGVCGWVATHRKPALVPDAYKDKRFLREVDELTGFKTKSVLAVPVIDHHELTGVLELINKRSGPFGEEDLRFMEAACRLTSLALHAASRR